MQCGAELAPGHRFCEKCGQPVAAVPAPQATQGPAAHNNGNVYVRKGQRKKWIIAGSLALLLLVMVVLMSGMLAGSGSDPQDMAESGESDLEGLAENWCKLIIAHMRSYLSIYDLDQTEKAILGRGVELFTEEYEALSMREKRLFKDALASLLEQSLKYDTDIKKALKKEGQDLYDEDEREDFIATLIGTFFDRE